MRNTTHVETTQQNATTLPPESTVTMPRLWDQKTLAAYLGKSTAWCERARWAGEGPRFIKLGRHVRYRAEDVLEWIDSHASAQNMEGAA
ncbi:helix-turn-helix transcriptional regulator [Marinobacter salinexigens]|nr:helix-turn-helix domain-containing protein [Marinobacter salinexigens]